MVVVVVAEASVGGTCRPSSRETLSSVMSGRLSISVAILKASWASLKMCDEEWMFFWMDSSTVCSLHASPDGPTAACLYNEVMENYTF